MKSLLELSALLLFLIGLPGCAMQPPSLWQDTGSDVISQNLNLERQSDGFNFNVGFGAGAHWFVSGNMAITTELRWQHISNAKTKYPNDGINAGLFLLGFSYFFDAPLVTSPRSDVAIVN